VTVDAAIVVTVEIALAVTVALAQRQSKKVNSCLNHNLWPASPVIELLNPIEPST
jgi:hypothetical protein